ncbi:MAG: hypothetical protein SGJ11_18195 [Phycisphaerae bacterium]|nr:hypothetical protein [Phycisphaerae bacterium]
MTTLGQLDFDRNVIVVAMDERCGETLLAPDTVIRIELEVLRMHDGLDVERTREELGRPLAFNDHELA